MQCGTAKEISSTQAYKMCHVLFLQTTIILITIIFLTCISFGFVLLSLISFTQVEPKSAEASAAPLHLLKITPPPSSISIRVSRSPAL